MNDVRPLYSYAQLLLTERTQVLCPVDQQQPRFFLHNGNLRDFGDFDPADGLWMRQGQLAAQLSPDKKSVTVREL